ncbi:helix-turn-helix domain-containing protein [Stenotrophomonas riyadhensis]
MLDELVQMPAEQLYLPVSHHPKVQALAEALSADPGDRSTIRQWAARLALGERTLTRLIERETGLSFGRWRQQLHLLIAIRELAGGLPVQRVFETLGYESVTAFITMFKKALGLSPTRYFAARLGGQPPSAAKSSGSADAGACGLRGARNGIGSVTPRACCSVPLRHERAGRAEPGHRGTGP